MIRLAVLIVFATLAAVPGAAQTAPADQAPVFRSGASLVSLNVTVTDKARKFVTGLAAEDFAVFEDGVQQDVRFFESSAVPIDLIILLDTSSSMRHRMELVHDAALGFARTLRAGDRAAVVAFNDRVQVLAPLTGDQPAIDDAIRSTAAGGGTALHNALYVALKQFGRRASDAAGEVRRQALAVLSDGADTASLIGFDDVLEVARTSGVSIYPIALSSEFQLERSASGSPIFSQSQYAMRTLAQETGAQAFFPESARELGRVYDAIAAELSSQYSIGYSPRNPRTDGRFRRIVVRVTSRPELRPRARTGYVAADQGASQESPRPQQDAETRILHGKW